MIKQQHITQKTLIDLLADELSIPRSQAKKIIKRLSQIIMTEVKAGKQVSITGFGAFYPGKRAARAGINPMTGDKIELAEIAMPRFRAGTQFKEMLRKS